MTRAPQRSARSFSVWTTSCDVARTAPPWMSDRSIFTMSKRIWESSRRPALPAPTSSAATRIPAARHASTAEIKRSMSSTDLALRQLEHHPTRIDAVALEQLHQPVDAELIGLERTRRDIQRQAAGQGQSCERRDRRRQAGQIQLDGPTERLGRREQVGRIGEAGARHRPAEGLEAARSTAAEIEDRLEHGLERPGGCDLRDQRGATRLGALAAGRPVALGIEHRNACPTVLLAERERGVGLPIHRGPIRGRPGNGRDADRERPRLGRGLVPPPVVGSALEDGRQYAAHREVGAVGVDARHQHGELVAADPEDLVAPAQASRQQPRYTDQDAIAAGVALGIVDLAEIVEIDDREGSRV